MSSLTDLEQELLEALKGYMDADEYFAAPGPVRSAGKRAIARAEAKAKEPLMGESAGAKNMRRMLKNNEDAAAMRHECPEWDGLVIDKFSPEFEACLCFDRACHLGAQG